jgi:hypothetical protein
MMMDDDGRIAISVMVSLIGYGAWAGFKVGA